MCIFKYRSRVPRGQVFHEFVVLGIAFTAEEALNHGVVDIAIDERNLMNDTNLLIRKTFAKNGQSYNRASMRNMKRDIFQEISQQNEQEIRKSKL